MLRVETRGGRRTTSSTTVSELATTHRRSRPTASPGAARASDHHFVNQPDNNFIAIRNVPSSSRSGPAAGDEFAKVYAAAKTVSANFLFAEFQWNNFEQFPATTHTHPVLPCCSVPCAECGPDARPFDPEIPLQRHLGSNNPHADQRLPE